MKTRMRICLWYENQAEEAARFYTSFFNDSSLGTITRFGKEGFEFHQQPEDSVMTIDFRLNDMEFVALNGKQKFSFNDSTSIMVYCDTQEEIDHYWSKLTESGEEGPCGWLKDKFGVSWQVIPTLLAQYLADDNDERQKRVEQVVMTMKKLDIETIRKAFEG